MELQERGIVQGDGQSFRPSASINRAEFLQILIHARFPAHTAQDLRCFRDLEVQTPQWYANAVCSARELGIVRGYADGFFRPEQKVNLAEALAMAFRAFGIDPVPDSSKPWYEPYILEARRHNILLPILKNPSHVLLREEMANIAHTLINHTNTTASVCGNGIKESAEQCDDSNTQDSDGCSSLCILVPEPVRIGMLQIDMETSGQMSSIAQGQRHVTMLKFSAAAARQDVLLTSLHFVPTIGSLLYANNYSLAVDRDGTGKYETIVAKGRTDGSHLVFDDFAHEGIVIPKNFRVRFALTADLVSTLGPVSLGLEFATNEPNYIEAQGADDGIALTDIETDNVCSTAGCFIRVNTQGATDVNVVERGNLWVSEDVQPATSHILLAGSITPPLLRLRFHSEGEKIDVRSLRIDGATSSVDSLLLYRLSPGEVFDPLKAVPFAKATNSQCSPSSATRLCAAMSLSTLLIEPNIDAIIVVAASLKNDVLGGNSGERITLSLSDATTLADHAIDARGISSMQDLIQNTGDETMQGEIVIGGMIPGENRQIVGRTHTTALANIQAITNAGFVRSDLIASGYALIGAVRISASAHNNTFHGLDDVIMKTMRFTVHAQNVQIDPASYALSTSEDPNTSFPCSATETTGSIVVTCSSIEVGAIQSRIGQGQSVVYQLRAHVTNTAIASGQSALHIELPILGQPLVTNSVIWRDGTTVFEWVDVNVQSVSGTQMRYP